MTSTDLTGLVDWCWLVVSLRHIGSIGHIHGENCLKRIQTAPSHSISTHNQFVPYEIKILDIKMSHCYFSIKLFDWLGKLYEVVQTDLTGNQTPNLLHMRTTPSFSTLEPLWCSQWAKLQYRQAMWPSASVIQPLWHSQFSINWCSKFSEYWVKADDGNSSPPKSFYSTDSLTEIDSVSLADIEYILPLMLPACSCTSSLALPAPLHQR